MTGPSSPERCVIVLDQSLPPGLAANAVAVLALTVGAHFPQLPGHDLIDADGTVHPGLIPRGLPVLSAPPERLGPLHAAALQLDLHVVDFPTAGQQTTDYAAFTATVASTPGTELTYLGLAVSGPTKPVRKVTGGLPLFR